MTDLVAVALITACPSTLAALIGFWNSAAVRRVERQASRTHEAMILLEKNTNSIKDALVKVTHDDAFEAGKRDQAQRGADIAAAVKDAQTIPGVVARQEGSQ
jgi:hypothetical protein